MNPCQTCGSRNCTDDRADKNVRGLITSKTSLLGWAGIFAFNGPRACTRASVACVAFKGPADSVGRTMTFGRDLLIVDGEPTLEWLMCARDRFPALRVDAIDLNRCNEIIDDFIVDLVKICPEIEHVNLAYCKKLTDVSILALAEKCKKLKSVNLRSCKLLTDVAIVAVAGNCPLLKSVHLADCELLTDASIAALAGSCPLLKRVGLRGCELLTDVSIGAFAGSCPLLESVDLAFCSLLTDVDRKSVG